MHRTICIPSSAGSKEVGSDMKIKLVRSEKTHPARKLVRDFYTDVERDLRDEKLRLEMVQNSADIWRTCLEKPLSTSPEIIQELKDVTANSLKFYWGHEATCEFNEERKSIICRHPDGRMIELKGEL